MQNTNTLSSFRPDNRKFTINGEEKEATWVDEKNGYRGHWEVDGIEFDGHYELWGFSYEPNTYLKESELSREEWRKGGQIKFFRNGIQVYEDFCRETERAAIKVLELTNKLQEIDWSKIKEGTKIYWRNVPAIIGYVMLEQGCFMVSPDGVDGFPDNAFAQENWEKLEDPKNVKIGVLDPHIWWWRK